MVQRIIIAEDDELVRSIVCLIVSGAGFSVNGVATFTEAVAAIDRGDFDLLISDVGLVDGSGYDLAERALRYGKPTILTSGYPERLDAPGAPKWPYFMKPFSFQDLIGSVREQLRNAFLDTANKVGSKQGGGR